MTNVTCFYDKCNIGGGPRSGNSLLTNDNLYDIIILWMNYIGNAITAVGMVNSMTTRMNVLCVGKADTSNLNKIKYRKGPQKCLKLLGTFFVCA